MSTALETPKHTCAECQRLEADVESREMLAMFLLHFMATHRKEMSDNDKRSIEAYAEEYASEARQLTQQLNQHLITEDSTIACGNPASRGHR